MKPSTSAAARSTPKRSYTSSSSSKPSEVYHSKARAPSLTAQNQVEPKVKNQKLSSLENIPRDLQSRCGTAQQSKLKVPTNVQERYSAGSPAKFLGTPIRSDLRNSETNVKLHTPEIFSTVRFETPKRNVMSDQAGVDAGDGVETSNLVVAVRVRPQTTKEQTNKEMKPIVTVKENEMSVLTDYGQTHSFNYDHCFSSIPSTEKQHDQAKVYNGLAKPLLAQAFKGFNTCLFAYGQTGSGKSYSVMGNIGSEKELNEAAGIVPRFCNDLFSKVENLTKSSTENRSFEIQISYFEIYKEKIQDLLCPVSKVGGSLRVREHPQNGPYVVDLKQHTVRTFEEVQCWLVAGNRQRATAATSANERSSRSHAIFTITLAQSQEENLDGKVHVVRKKSRINFIDLAGSERVASTHLIGDRREEGLTINQSLLTLGRVITALAEQNFVPYRESVLTWLLKESLGGDSKTVMLATVSPCAGHLEETLSTLRYACQARKIINTARICEDANTRHIRSLTEKIKLLENQLSANMRPGSSAIFACASESSSRLGLLESEILSLKNRLKEFQSQKDVSWQNKVTQAETKRAEAEEALANYGQPNNERDPQQPCLVNVNQDPLLSGTLFYPLNAGENWVGPPICSPVQPAIELTGLMIEENHCCIEMGENLRLTANAETYVNGQLVTSSGVVLHHGDRIIIGGTHYFHLHNPADCHNSAKRSTAKALDFEMAYEELRHFQEKRLQEAVEEEKEKARIQFIAEIEEVRQEAALEISLQRHAYEDEIASLNRDLHHRQLSELDSPSLPTLPTTKSTNFEEIEAMLLDTKRKLEEQPAKSSPKESSFIIQSMINEANAICRRFQQPYTFSRKETLSDELQSVICIRDRDRHLIMLWSVEKLRQRLGVLREAVDEAEIFPTDAVFERGDAWQLEDDASVLSLPSLKEMLGKIVKRNDSSMNVLDESRFSLDSSRRSSFLPRSPTFNTGVANTCQEIMSKYCYGDEISTFVSTASSLQHVLDHPDRTPAFILPLTVHAMSLLNLYPGLVHNMIKKKDVPSSIRNSWLQNTKELGEKLRNSIEFVMQGISLDSVGLFNEWIHHTQNSLNAILSNYYEISIVYCNEIPTIEMLPLATAITGFVSAQKKVHEAIIKLADDVRMKITLLPDENSIDSFDNSSFINNGGLMKACHDSVAQVFILLEQIYDNIDRLPLVDEKFGAVQTAFHQRIDILLRMGDSIEHLFLYLELADLSQVKICAAALEAQTTAYLSHMGVVTDRNLCDVSFAIGTVHKIVAERRRMTALRRGRDVSYSPLPARLLASPSRKSTTYDDVMESDVGNATFDVVNSDDDDSLDDVSISPTAIRKALQFKTPSKSSLKSNESSNIPRKSVHFNISDSPVTSLN